MARIDVTLALSEAQANKIQHLWWFERAMAAADKNRLDEDPNAQDPSRRDPSYLEYHSMESNGDIGEVIRLADGTYVYRYRGERRSSLARPSYDWLKDFSLESLPALAYEADDDPALTWYFPIAYEPEREAADRERERNRTFEVVNMTTGERRLLTPAEYHRGLPKNVHLLEKLGTSGRQALDKRFPGWNERPPVPPASSNVSHPTDT